MDPFGNGASWVTFDPYADAAAATEAALYGGGPCDPGGNINCFCA